MAKLTQAAIAAAKSAAAQSGAAQILRDDVVTGLYARVDKLGRTTFYMRYRVGSGRGKPIKEPKLGELSREFPIEAARRRGLQLKAEGQQGRDLIAERKAAEAAAESTKVKRADLVTSLLLDEWMKYLAAREKRWSETERIVERELKPAWGDMQANEIGHDDVLSLVKTVTDRAKNSGRKNASGAQGHKVLQTARRFFAWAKKQRKIDENPAADLQAPVVEKTRSRQLNDAEIAAFWSATGSMGYPFGQCLRLLLLTGQRLRMASEAEKGELQESNDREPRWRIPPERTKNGKVHLLPLGPAATDILRIAAKTTPSKTCLFSTDDTPISGWSKKKQELDRLMLVQLRLAEEAKGKDPAPASLPDWVFHDMRRTMSTLMVDRCDVLPEIASLIRHNLPKNADETDAIYMLSRREKEMRAALAAWEAEVMRIVESQERGRE